MTIDMKLGLPSVAFGGALSLLMLAGAGCVVPKLVGDGLETDGGDGTGSGSVTDTEPVETASSGEADTGVESICEDNPLFQCVAPYDCGAFPCGGLSDWFDADGCMRTPCSETADCGVDETCFVPIEYGGCASSGIDCFEEPDGSCTCGADPDCGGRYCVPVDEIPGGTCFGQPDEEACMNEGCSDFRTVVQIADTCECTLDAPTCLMFNGDGTGGSAGYFWHEDTLTVAYFELGVLEALPYGWRRCSDAEAPAACGCNAPMAEPMCP